ncbi:MAG: tRNA preQ1(34) S-adenosylmethionine ribosyltransferase-isomerase QueA [Rhodospirillales bacterium RIFCSPLOWO2_12_FULL_58_28]|nr:MAG: tRNA preQ1(34) S-adenosylmethionine ribosyltransferase-isomerase QueA [Rhodospirillales bacterium RIFCSPLOWO2_02_FULL_58_16]OHC77801.1 MAG: tRNA preQ1(34) S-adenosylmethionine ribosyltransferase-isomerase QueA [Rhodospirillales bacterium RIFCSPLOWO2_12_FULL_58_28]
MKVDLFDFDLPPDLIARRPASPRDSARLLAVGEGLRDLSVRDLPGLLRRGDIMVFNDTRVIPARLKGRRGRGGVEATLHRRDAPGVWRAFARPARRLNPGDDIDFAPGLSARVAAKGEYGEVTLDFAMDDESLGAALERFGAMPLPPYIKRPALADAQDSLDYQTMFARQPGAVAAPTAALHFTPELMAALAAHGIEHVFVTLHVGAGTFLPVRTEAIKDHKMHAESGEISPDAADAVNRTRARGGRIVAVGSTGLRLLETAAAEDGTIRPFTGETDIFITPGYRFKAVNMMLTNFHLPRSTLFMLVSAFAGLDAMKRAYRHAIDKGYRFYSYGDCCLLEREEKA